MTRLSRREFAALAASGVAVLRSGSAPALAQAPITAADVIERIRKSLGVEPKADTVDTLKAGDPATTITGLVTTALASLAVLRQAVDAGANLVLTCEPAFYGRSDAREAPAGRGGGRGGASPPPSPPPADPVYAAKNAFIDKHRLVVFRLCDGWRLRRPDPFVQGLAAALGWADRQAASGTSRFEIPAVSLATLAGQVKAGLGSRGGIRVVGARETRVQRVALLPGSTPLAAALDALPAVDALVAGEVREWESVEYVRDVVASDRKKGLILVGRIASEEGGMRACAAWLGTVVPEVPVRHLASGDPYWRPA
jgi:putative NIF3 family GTP cyclohydrolase 1 type 2